MLIEEIVYRKNHGCTTILKRLEQIQSNSAKLTVLNTGQKLKLYLEMVESKVNKYVIKQTT